MNSSIKSFRPTAWLGLGLLAFAIHSTLAHVSNHPSVHDTVAGIIERMKKEMTADQLREVTLAQVERFLAPKEREILANEHIHFKVNVPVRVTVLHDAKLANDPFWLAERGFKATGVSVKEGKNVFDAWEKTFPAGEIGLGVHALTGSGNHYLVTLAPTNPTDKVEVTDLYPGNLRTTEFRSGVEPYVDQIDVLHSVPGELAGQTLIQVDADREEAAKLINIFRWTQYPATEKPDQIVLTWSDDPKTSQAIQWRTSTKIKRGFVSYAKKADFNRFNPRKPIRVAAVTTKLETPTLLNDQVVHRHTAVLRNLAPGTTYVYSVGDGSDGGWTELAEFTTAPAGTQPFSFVYMGDAQNGLDRWGSLVHNAFRSRPDAAFYVMAGDIINRGAERNDWDSFFYNAADIYDRRQLVPALGNHEYQGGAPRLYLEQFALPHNGPRTIPPECAYSFEYGNALFVVLDSNLSAKAQTQWLEEKLSQTKATWKFAVYHHPAYSSGGNRDNLEVRTEWVPLFDKYHVDLALQGHDHAYLRTYPMKGNQRVKDTKTGTVYIISVSGTKHYSQAAHDYTEFGMTNVSTYQVLDIQISGNRLVYRAYDTDGKLRDEFVIEK